MKKAASTADILGFSSKPRIPFEWSEHHRNLCTLRDQLESIEAPRVESERTDDVADSGSAEIEQNLELTTHRATRETLGEVLAAIRRIERGSYGLCELTGEPIEPERLAATPWTRYSFTGQTELERTFGNTHARLASRESLIEAEVEAGDGEETEEPKERAA